MIQMSQEWMHSRTLFLLGTWLWLGGSCMCSPPEMLSPVLHLLHPLFPLKLLHTCALTVSPSWQDHAACCRTP